MQQRDMTDERAKSSAAKLRRSPSEILRRFDEYRYKIWMEERNKHDATKRQ